MPVSMAGVNRPLGGTVRVGPVYTPVAYRRRGYAAAVTAAVSRAALEAGAAAVVLFTDLANATSNSPYQRLGYRPVGDRVVIRFERSSLRALRVMMAILATMATPGCPTWRGTAR